MVVIRLTPRPFAFLDMKKKKMSERKGGDSVNTSTFCDEKNMSGRNGVDSVNSSTFCVPWYEKNCHKGMVVIRLTPGPFVFLDMKKKICHEGMVVIQLPPRHLCSLMWKNMSRKRGGDSSNTSTFCVPIWKNMSRRNDGDSVSTTTFCVPWYEKNMSERNCGDSVNASTFCDEKKKKINVTKEWWWFGQHLDLLCSLIWKHMSQMNDGDSVNTSTFCVPWYENNMLRRNGGDSIENSTFCIPWYENICHAEMVVIRLKTRPFVFIYMKKIRHEGMVVIRLTPRPVLFIDVKKCVTKEWWWFGQLIDLLCSLIWKKNMSRRNGCDSIENSLIWKSMSRRNGCDSVDNSSFCVPWCEKKICHERMTKIRQATSLEHQ